MLHSTWDLPGPGIELISLALDVVLVYAMGSYLDFPVSGLFTAMSNSIWNFLLVSDFLIYKNFFVYG